jgi:hypothetical protein
MTLNIIVIILSIIVAIEMVFMYKLARVIGEFLNRFQYAAGGMVTKRYLQVGQQAPIINSKNQNNQKANFHSDKRQFKILIFKDVNCGTCQLISEKLPSLVNNLKSNVDLLVIQKDPPIEEMVSKVQYFTDKKAFEDYRIDRVPTLFIVDNNGAILKISNMIGSFDDFLQEISPFLNLKAS